MSIKSQLRAAKSPAAFVDCIRQAMKQKEDVNIVVPDHFGQMTAMVFDEIYSSSAKDFNALHGLALHPVWGGPLLAHAFYNAARQGFASVNVDRRARSKDWPAFFGGIAQTVRSDGKLTALVNQETIVKQLPAIVWAIDHNDRATDAATGIICALGDVPMATNGLDPEIVTTLLSHHIANEGGEITAAPKLMELRASAPFLDAIVARENASGLHVAASAQQRDPSCPYAGTVTFALAFSRSADDVAVHQLDYRRDRWVSTCLKDHEEGGCRQHADLVANALIDYSSAPLPGQDWVRGIAERVAFEIA